VEREIYDERRGERMERDRQRRERDSQTEIKGMLLSNRMERDRQRRETDREERQTDREKTDAAKQCIGVLSTDILVYHIYANNQ